MPTSHTILQHLRVFLCHSSGDKASVRGLYNRLRRAGFSPWLDERNLIPGQRWNEKIKKAVRECDVIIVCLSKDSITKEGYVQKEIKFALDAEEEKPEGTIFIIPALLEDLSIPERLSDWQHAKLFEKDGFKKLIRALKTREDQIGAHRGDAFAQYRLGLSHIHDGATEQDYREAFRLFEQAAQADHTGAANYLGILYNHGLGVPQDYRKAREWHEKAASAGDIYAMCNLGLSHETGRGVPQDYEQARYWFEKAASGGHSAAMNYLGILYNNGLGVPQDYEMARGWHEKAAAAGNPAAMYNLGLSYDKGRGVEKDQHHARHWFEQAAKAGNANARKRLSELKIATAHREPASGTAGPTTPLAKTVSPRAKQELDQTSSSHQVAHSNVHLQLAMFEAERVRDQFKVNTPKLYRLLQDAVIRSYQQEAQSRAKKPDPAKILVNIQLDAQEVAAILRCYKHLSGPTDETIYRVINHANDRHEQLEQIKTSILRAQITNRLFPLLHSLREFFHRYQELLNLKSNELFYEKWLVHPMVEMNMQAGSSMWTAERVAELHSELRLIQC